MTVAKDDPQNEGDVTIIKPVLPEKLPLLKPGHEAAARHRFCGLPEVIFAGGIYCMASTGMVRGGGMAACISKPCSVWGGLYVYDGGVPAGAGRLGGRARCSRPAGAVSV